MPYFPMLDFQDLVLAFGLGLGFVVLLYLALTGYQRARKEAAGEELERLVRGDLAGVHDPQRNRIPPVLVLIYLGVVIWSISYVVVVGIKGVAF